MGLDAADGIMATSIQRLNESRTGPAHNAPMHSILPVRLKDHCSRSVRVGSLLANCVRQSPKAKPIAVGTHLARRGRLCSSLDSLMARAAGFRRRLLFLPQEFGPPLLPGNMLTVNKSHKSSCNCICGAATAAKVLCLFSVPREQYSV